MMCWIFRSGNKLIRVIFNLPLEVLQETEIKQSQFSTNPFI